MGRTGSVEIWARPGSPRDGIGWDPWRRKWVVSCRALPHGGEANRALLGLIAGWLRLDPAELRWRKAGRSAEKVLEVPGLADPEIAERLRMAGSVGAGRRRS